MKFKLKPASKPGRYTIFVLLLAAFLWMTGAACADQTLEIPASTTEIMEEAFAGDASITSVHFPSGLEHISQNAFKGCSSIADLYYEGTPEEWDLIQIDKGNEPLFKAKLHCLIGQGMWGTCKWEIDENGVLTVHAGTGADCSVYIQTEHSPWEAYKREINAVVMDEEIIFPEYCNNLFYELQCSSISLKGVRTDHLILTDYMFYRCTELESLDLSCFNTSNVQSMRCMFAHCYSLKDLNLSTFDTANVGRMDFMFYGCCSLEEMNLNHFKTTSATGFEYMFGDCIALKTLQIQGFDTRNAAVMESMFSNCYHLESIRVGKLFSFKGNTDHILATLPEGDWISKKSKTHFTADEIAENRNLTADTYTTEIQPVLASGMWGTCAWTLSREGILHIGRGIGENTNETSPWEEEIRRKVTRIEFEKGVTFPKDVSRLFEQFYNCLEIDLSGVNTASVQNMKEIFRFDARLQSIDLSMFSTKKVTDLSGLFAGCVELRSIELGAFDTGNATTMNFMFSSCKKLSQIDLRTFNTGHVTNMGGMFSFCESLKELDVSGFDTSGVTLFGGMFQNCSSLSALDVSGFDTSRATNLAYMFGNCSSLKELDLSGFHTENVKTISGMFCQCQNLITLDIHSFRTENVTDMSELFCQCESLRRLDVSGFDTSNVTTMRSMFADCLSLKSLDVSGFKTSGVTDMSNMFLRCQKLKKIDISGFDVQNTRYFDSMFTGCSSITKLDLHQFNAPNIEDFIGVFSGCEQLRELDMTGFNTKNASSCANAFNGCDRLEVITVGENFSFTGKSRGTAYLPDRPWFADSDGMEYTAKEITENRNLTADTYRIDDGFDYDYEDETYCTVIGYHGRKTSLDIREKSPYGHIVHAIGDSAFADMTGITGGVTIPKTVNSIGNSAFSGCINMTGNLVIPSGVKTIGDSAFENCGSLNGTLKFGKKLVSIGARAFYGCGLSGNLTLPRSITTIGEYAFAYCQNFTGALTVNKELKVIPDGVFTECNGFDGSLIIEDGITEIGNSAFASKYPNHFTGGLVIPDSVTSIGEYAFMGCGCSGTLTISTNITEIRTGTFAYGQFTGSLTIPEGVISIGNGAFLSSRFTGTLTLPNTLTSIGGEAFFNYNEQKPFIGDLILPDSVTSVGSCAFMRCGFNGRLVLSRFLQVIPDGCFAYNDLTGKLYIPGKIQRIGGTAFSYNKFTGDLIIPDNVLYASGFDHCTFDGQLVLSRSLKEIPYGAFEECTGFSGSIIIPEGVTIIREAAFKGCTGFDGELQLPDSLTQIERSAFLNCSGLGGNIMLPKNVTSIDYFAFNGCSSIDGYISIGEKLTSAWGKPFDGTNPKLFLLKKNSYALETAEEHGFTPYQILEKLELTLHVSGGEEEDDPITANCIVTGGLAPYTYKYEVNISDGSYYYTDWRTNKTSKFYPVKDGYYSFTVSVRDALGNTVTKTAGNVYRHLLTEEENDARKNLYFARYMSSFFFSEISSPESIQGYWYYYQHDDLYPWVVQFIEYLSKFNPMSPSFYIDLYNELFDQKDAKGFLLEQALVMCSTGNDFEMYDLSKMPDNIKPLNSFTKLLSLNDNSGFLNILHKVTGNSDSQIDSIFNGFCKEKIKAGELSTKLSGIVKNADDRTLMINSMKLLKGFRTFKDLTKTYGIMKSIYDDIVVDTMNTLSLLDSIDQGQLYALADTWIQQTGNPAQQEVGQLLKNLAGASREDQITMLLTRNGYKSLIYCWGKLLDSGSKKLIKLNLKSKGASESAGLAVYSVATSVIELFAGQESYADKFQELQTSTDIVNTAWNDFIQRRAQYENNPSAENFERVIHSCMNYLQSAAVSETTFADLVEEARGHVILMVAGFGQPMLEAAGHSKDHAAALNAFAGSIRQYFREWQAIDNYDYSIIKSHFANALSEYQKWSYESYSKQKGGW